jgi:hypothetical protein
MTETVKHSRKRGIGGIVDVQMATTVTKVVLYHLKGPQDTQILCLLTCSARTRSFWFVYPNLFLLLCDHLVYYGHLQD